MASPNSGQTCNPVEQVVKQKITIECPSTVPNSRTGGYATTLNSDEWEYVDTVYNEIDSISLTNGVIREKWDNSNDPRFQQYNIDNGQPIFENYCRSDAGIDEGYFQHLWEFPTSHVSNREVLVKYTPIYEDNTTGVPTTRPGAATAASVTANNGSCVRKVNVTNNFTLGKVVTSLSGLPSGDDESFIKLVGTDTVEIVFQYTSDTRTVLQIGDTINGHVVTDVVNFSDTRADRKIVHRVNGDSVLKLNNIKNIAVGDNVIGYGGTVIPEGTTIKSINSTKKTIRLNFPSGFVGLNPTQTQKIRTVLIQDANQNQIPDTNYCWAKLGSSAGIDVKNIAFKVEGKGIHYMDFQSTTNTNGTWNNNKINNEGGNAIFDSGSTRTKTVKFDGGELVLKAEPINDGGEYDSDWYISSFTGSLPSIGTSFQTKLDGGKGKATVHFKIVGNTTSEVASGGVFVKDATYTGSLSGASIRVKAGYGIIDRAAAVGIFISSRKDVMYTPVFKKKQEIFTPELKELKNNLPGLGDLKQFRDAGGTTPVVDTNCQPYLTPPVNLPTVIGNANNSIKLSSSDSTVIADAIDDKLDEITSDLDVDEMVAEIEKLVASNQDLSVSNQFDVDSLQSNLNKVTKADTSDNKFTNNADPSLSQDTASNKLINDILGKINEIPDDLGILLPEGTPTSVDVIDGDNESDFILVKNAYRDLPASQDMIQFIAEDISLNDDESYLDYGKNSLRTTITMSVTPRWIYGTPTVSDEIAEEAELTIAGDQIGGVAGGSNDLYLLVSNVSNSGSITDFQTFNGSIPLMNYTNQSGTSTVVGARASFNIDAITPGSTYTATINTNATGYSVNDIITIKGSQLMAVDDINDCFIYVNSLTGTNEIGTFTVVGTSDSNVLFGNVSQLITEASFDVNIEWSNTDTITDDVYTASINDINVGSGYRVNDTINIPGSNLGGTANNDCIITVTEVDANGGLSDFTVGTTERPLTLFTNVSASYASGASNTSIGTGATFNVLKGENSSGTPAYFVSLNQGGSNYNTVVSVGGITVDVVDKSNGIMQINNGDLTAYPANFQVSFGSTAPSPLSANTAYKATKISNTKFFVYTEQSFVGRADRGILAPLATRIRLSQSLTGITGVSFGAFGLSQTVNYITDNGVQYVDTIDVSGIGESYPDKTWRGAGYEYQSDWIKEYEFNLITTSENIAKSSFNEGNPIQSKPTIAKLTKKLKPKSNKIEVDDTSLFLSSGYLLIPKWMRKTENYLELGVEGVNKTTNARNHYYYDGEEIIYYSSKTATSFEGIQRSQFDSSYLFETSPEPYAKNGGVVNSYQKGYSVQQYWPYQPKEE